MHRIASGAPRHSNASRGKTAFHIHGCFLRKGRKGTGRREKEQGTPFVSVSNMVSFHCSFSIVKGSPGVLICYQAPLYLPACVKVAQLLLWMRQTHHIYLPGIYRAFGLQGSSPKRSTKAGLCIKSRPSSLSNTLCVDAGGQSSLHIPASTRRGRTGSVSTVSSFWIFTRAKMKDYSLVHHFLTRYILTQNPGHQ